MLSEPAKLYGQDVGSNYQGQVDTLSKHFRREKLSEDGGGRGEEGQLDLFAAEPARDSTSGP